MAKAAQDKSPDKAPDKVSATRKRSAARLSAVQALYELEVSGSPVDPVLRGFMQERWKGRDEEFADQDFAAPDGELLAALVRGVTDQQAKLDEFLEGALSGDWTVPRLEAVLRCILRAGVYELHARPDVPAKVVITEYVDVANAFFDGAEPKMVNGVLDGLARVLRSAEIG